MFFSVAFQKAGKVSTHGQICKHMRRLSVFFTDLRLKNCRHSSTCGVFVNTGVVNTKLFYIYFQRPMSFWMTIRWIRPLGPGWPPKTTCATSLTIATPAWENEPYSTTAQPSAQILALERLAKVSKYLFKNTPKFNNLKIIYLCNENKISSVNIKIFKHILYRI